MTVQQKHFTDINAAPFDARALVKNSKKRLPLYDAKLRDRHVALRERCATLGAEKLSDKDMLELLLLRSTPREDTGALAQSMLDEFGSFADVISADRHRIEAMSGAGAASDVLLIKAAAQRLSSKRIAHRPLISSWDAVLTYCRTHMAYKDKEELRVLFLDRRNMLIADEVMAEGTVDHVPVYPREILKRALDLNACALILVHNHPSGDPTPSEADKIVTQDLKKAADGLSIALHDHLIIGSEGETSFVSEGLL